MAGGKRTLASNWVGGGAALCWARTTGIGRVEGSNGVKFIAGFIGSLLCLTVPAAARDGQVLVGDTSYRVTLPDGYCDSGDGVDHYVARKGKRPSMLMLRCGKEADGDYYIIDVTGSKVAGGRPAYLAGMIRTMPDKPAGIDAMTPEGIARRLDDVLKDQASVTGGFKPIGVDDVCAYAFGNKQVAGANAGKGLMVISCATVIDSQVVYFFRYLPDDDLPRARIALGELRRMAVAIAPAPTA